MLGDLLGISNATILSAVGMTTGIGMIGYAVLDYLLPKDKANDICKYNELKSLMGDGIRLSKHVRLSVKQSNTHVLEIAPSNSGKSRKFMMPNVNSLTNCSIICTDPSGEIEKTCITNKKKYILNPFSNDTIGYDPLLNCKDEFEVRKIAKVILINGMNVNSDKNKGNQEEWVNMSVPLLAAYMLMNYHTKQYSFDEMIKNICTMPIISEVTRDKEGKVIKATKSIELEIIMSKVESAITEIQSFKQVMGAVQTLSSIRTVMNSCLQLFLDNNVKKIFSKKNIKLSDLRKEESIVYIQIPERHADYFSPLVATFLTQMFDSLLDNTDGLQIYCLFDEFTNSCGVIPNIGKLLSTCRKHRISICAAIQSLNQLYTLYGELAAKELSELFSTIIVAGGLRDSTEYISKILGTKEYYENETKHTEPLMTPDQIRRMDKEELLIICNNKRPVIDRMMEIVV